MLNQLKPIQCMFFIAMNIKKLFMPFSCSSDGGCRIMLPFCILTYAILPISLAYNATLSCVVSLQLTLQFHWKTCIFYRVSSRVLLIVGHSSESFVVNVLEWSLKVCEICLERQIVMAFIFVLHKQKKI